MRLVLTIRAEADIDEIAAYINARNPRAARLVESELQAAFRLISAYPLVGREVRNGVRRFPLPRYPYLVLYGIDQASEEIRVFTVRHGARREEQ